MIETSRLLMVGRDEPPTETTRIVHMVIEPWIERARVAWVDRWPDRLEDWQAWNVVAFVGSFRSWEFVDLLTYDGLGRTALPTLTSRIRYVPLIDHIDPEPVDRLDPLVLHRSWRVMPPPVDGQQRGWIERLKTLEKRLGSVLDHPDAQTRNGFHRTLRRRGLKLSEGIYGHFKLLPAPRWERPLAWAS